jgi:histidyl-tRNA synthetase
VTLGDSELEAGTIVVKDMQSGEQQTMPQTDLDQYLLARR